MANTKLDSCGIILKIFFVFLNILFLLVGLAIIAGGIYLAVISSQYSCIIGKALIIGATCIIVASILGCVISVMGLVAALAQWRILLVVYAVIIVVITVLELAFGIFIFAYSGQLIELAEDTFSGTMHRYGNYSEVTESVDLLQTKFECCGVETPGDWLTTNYYTIHGALPPSCCSGPASNQSCEVGGTDTHSTGCFTKVFGLILGREDAMGGVAIIVGLVQVLGVVAALWLCCSVHKKRKQPITKSGPELARTPLKVQCIQCLSKICPCIFPKQPDVPSSL